MTYSMAIAQAKMLVRTMKEGKSSRASEKILREYFEGTKASMRMVRDIACMIQTGAEQRAHIYAWLQSGGELTSIKALKEFGCFRLAARINELRKSMEIKDRWVTTDTGKRVKAYSL